MNACIVRERELGNARGRFKAKDERHIRAQIPQLNGDDAESNEWWPEDESEWEWSFGDWSSDWMADEEWMEYGRFFGVLSE